MDTRVEPLFLAFSADKLEQLSQRIADCLGRLSQDQIWARGSDNENAAGNLVLHLCGNIHQWIGSGVAGRRDDRQRDAEFAARGALTPGDLSARLQAAVTDVTAVIRGLDPERLTEKTTVQGYEVAVLEAIYHVVEHFAQHTGQIIFATKQLTGQDLGYYGHLKGRTAGHGETTP